STTIANYYTKTEIQHMFLNLIDNAPASLDTLNELANALADDANYAATIQNQLALKQPTITSSTDLTINTDHENLGISNRFY
ncbi:MAG: phage tail protein, partial [Candidatus Fonsibacter sp.]